jgi:hypothetical protein
MEVHAVHVVGTLSCSCHYQGIIQIKPLISSPQLIQGDATTNERSSMKSCKSTDKGTHLEKVNKPSKC